MRDECDHQLLNQLRALAPKIGSSGLSRPGADADHRSWLASRTFVWRADYATKAATIDTPGRSRSRIRVVLGAGSGSFQLQLRNRPQGPRMDNSIVLAADPSPGPSLLLGHVPTGMLPRRASAAGRLDRDHRSIYPFEGPHGRCFVEWQSSISRSDATCADLDRHCSAARMTDETRRNCQVLDSETWRNCPKPDTRSRPFLRSSARFIDGASSCFSH